ncbi:MAG: DUF3450 domain-containing protein [Desulfobacteraceae bacterium]|nr:DUF3450 domain-containing protein [Desulfobacteraceae bacterium]
MIASFRMLLPGVLLIMYALPALAIENGVGAQVEKITGTSVEIRQKTQKQEESWSLERKKLLMLYEQLEQRQKVLLDSKNQLEQQTFAAQQRIAVKKKQLTDSELILERINPFILELVEKLRQQVAEDMPFLSSERKNRIGKLVRMTQDPEVTTSEKLRKTMEALLVEAEYANTIEVCQETILVDQAMCLVNILRLGRVSLFYQTLDHQRCGYFDTAASGWRPLPGHYNRSIQKAIEIGAKQRPVELLDLPLGKMTVQ